MGQQIVYCGNCGTSLRQDDFEKGKALEVDAIPYCSRCLPASAAGKLAPRPEAARNSISSTKIRPLPPPPSTRRKAQGTSSKAWIAGGAAALAGLALLVALLSGGPTPPAAPPAPPPPAEPSTSAAAQAWARLEGFAQAAEPDAVLMKCEEASNALRGTPYEPRLRDLEARTREKKKARDVERQFAQSIEEARKFARSDARFDRPEEFRHLLNRLLAAPGAHQAEIRRIAEVWEKELKDVAPPPPPPASATPFALGPQGEVGHWLVLGTFANTPDNGGLYLDSFRPEAQHVPAEGLEVTRREGGKLSWIRQGAPDGTLDFRRIPSAGSSTAPAIAFAACWLVVERETKLKFRVNADTGCRVRLNAEQIGNMPRGFELGKDPETYARTLAPGANLVLLKVGTAGGPHRLRFRVTTTPSLTEPAPGVTVSLRPPAPKALFRESFDGGVGRFTRGTFRDNALEVTNNGVEVEKPTTATVSSGTTLRFRYKAPAELKTFYVLSWSLSRKANHWYHFQGIKTGEWTTATLPLKELKGGYRMDGPSLEGEVPSNLIFKFDGPAGVSFLIDDVEITE